jgi:RNA polymerase sigma factor (TIGR02999 family)
MAEITAILSAVAQGEPHAAEKLLPLVYHELRQLAAAKFAQEKPGQTLQPTALVHEAYLRLVVGPLRQRGQEPRWDGRGHFLAAAAEAMRRILVENARRKRSTKHGGGRRRHDAAEVPLAAPERADDLLALDEALERLDARDHVKASLVKLRYFAGMTLDEAAAALGISTATAKRYWAYSRAWLYEAIAGDPAAPADESR